MHGQFAWYDLVTPDASAAKKFYLDVMGWGTEQWDKADYTMWTAGGKPLGGTMAPSPHQTAQGVKPHWLAYVNVDDVDASSNKVRSLGGKVMHGPENIPNVGRFAIIEDPHGASLALFRSSNPTPGWDGTPALGAFTWHELMTTDYPAAFDFYRQLFGWEKTGEFDMGGTAGKYITYGMKGKSFGGMFNRQERHGNMRPNWVFYVNVKDVDRAAERARKNGGQIVLGPMDVPGGDRVAVGVDAQGAMFAIVQSAVKQTAAATRGAKRKAVAKSARSARTKPARSRRAKSARKSAGKARTKVKSRTSAGGRKTSRKRGTAKRGKPRRRR